MNYNKLIHKGSEYKTSGNNWHSKSAIYLPLERNGLRYTPIFEKWRFTGFYKLSSGGNQMCQPLINELKTGLKEIHEKRGSIYYTKKVKTDLSHVFSLRYLILSFVSVLSPKG